MKNSYTHGCQQDVLRTHQQRTAENSAAYLIPHLTPGDHVLDIGAGPGTITADFARMTGRITATEINSEALSLSQQHFQDQGLTSTAGIDAAFSVEDIHELSFPRNTFDATHAHQVLQHVKDPVKALTEMARVLKSWGYLAARDADYGGFLWFPESEPITRTPPKQRHHKTPEFQDALSNKSLKNHFFKRLLKKKMVKIRKIQKTTLHKIEIAKTIKKFISKLACKNLPTMNATKIPKSDTRE